MRQKINIASHSYLIIVMAFSCLSLQAQLYGGRSSVIKGTVQNKSKTPVEYATVYLKGTNLSTQSDVNGNFFLRVPSGSYTVCVQLVGYYPYEQSLIVKPSDIVFVHPTLIEKDQKLKEVTVEGKSTLNRVKESAYNVVAVDANKLANSSTDIAHAMQQVSGVKLRESGGLGSDMTFSLNGFSGKHIKFFMDGVPMEGMGASFQINNIPINMADRIEIYKGVVPVGFGADAIGGVVNIVTKQKQRTYADISYSYGSFNTHKTSANIGFTSKNGLMLEFNAFQNYSDNSYKINTYVTYLTRYANGAIVETANKNKIETVKRFHDTYHNETLIGKIGLVNKPYADRLMLSLNVGNSHKDIQTGVVQEVVYGQKFTENQTIMPSLQYSKRNLFTKGLNVTYTANYNYNLMHNVDTSAYKYNWLGQSVYTGTLGESGVYQDSKYANKNWNSTLNATYAINKRHTFTFNDVLTSYSRTLRSSVADADLSAADSLPKVTRKNVMGLSYKYSIPSVFNVSLFGKYYYQYVNAPADTSSATSHKKYVMFSKTYNIFSYGLAATYFWRDFQVKASYEKAYRLPTENELFGDQDLELGQANLRPERSYNYNLGLSYSKRINDIHFVYLDATLMLRNTKDYIKRDVNTYSGLSYGRYVNYGYVKNIGFNGEARYGYKNLISVGVSVTSQNIRDYEKNNTSNSTSTEYKARIANTPYFFANSDLAVNWNHFLSKENTLTFGYDNSYIYEFPLRSIANGSASSKAWIPTQFSHNASMTYVMAQGRYNVSVECQNITDAKLYDNYSLQKPGRAFYVKVRYYFSK